MLQLSEARLKANDVVVEFHMRRRRERFENVAEGIDKAMREAAEKGLRETAIMQLGADENQARPVPAIIAFALTLAAGIALSYWLASGFWFWCCVIISIVFAGGAAGAADESQGSQEPVGVAKEIFDLCKESGLSPRIRGGGGKFAIWISW